MARLPAVAGFKYVSMARLPAFAGFTHVSAYSILIGRPQPLWP